MKNNPYHLFRTMEDIHNFQTGEVDLAYELFKEIALPFDKSFVNKAFLLLESNTLKPTFLNDLKEYKNLFVCDFKNKDYFWLNELVSI